MYDEKQIGYFKNIRKELLDLIPEKNRNGSMLEVGAAEGETLLYAKKHNYANKVYAIELMKIPNSKQNCNEFESFIIANIEDMHLNYEKESFDVILFADVLEHLIDPYKVLYKFKKYLKKDGVIIASIPNIRNWKILKTIFIRGDFKYEDSGILDKTHLRFFTKKNIMNLFEDNGYSIIFIQSNNRGKYKRYLKQLRLFKFCSNLCFNEFNAEQYYVCAKKE
jgi:2-polyprenyl-3-methyl-5-hydroxy-6-metoxy-1,4-benzoquinol methylase